MARLSQAILRSIGRTMIPRLFDSGFSGNAALNQLKSLGVGYQRQLFQEDWREITGAKKLERAYRFIPRKFALSYALMAPTATYQDKEFKYIFEVEGRDTVTGKQTFRTMSMGSDTRYAPDDVEDYYSDILDAESDLYKDMYAFEPVAVSLRVVYRRKWET